MGRAQQVNRLLGLEIDEVSSVDRPANQHGLVAFTKRDEGQSMGTGLYDENGTEFADNELEAGMVAFDENGDQHILLTQEDAERLEAEGYDLDNLVIPDDASELDDDANQLTLATVGKSGAAAITGGKSSLTATGRGIADRLLGLKDEAGKHALRGTMRTRAAVQQRPIAAVAAGAGGAGAAGYGSGRMKKSLGEQVLAELSKAYTDGDRDQVISRVAKAAELADQRAERAEKIAKALEDKAELTEYVELAKSYELPVEATELGAILQTIAKSGLSDAQLETVDRIFHSASEALYDETGYSGRGDSPVMELLSGAALDVIGKADVSVEQATASLLDAQPDLYLDYLREN